MALTWDRIGAAIDTMNGEELANGWAPFKRWADRVDLRDLVTSYVARHEPGRSDAEAIGLFRLRGQLDPIDAERSPADLPIAIGAHACAMRRSDAAYALDAARRLFQQSRRAAEAEERRLMRGVGRESHRDATMEFATYALARWLNASACLFYRQGDLTSGRRLATRACEIADSRELWWLIPGFLSDRERIEQEERRVREPKSFQSLRNQVMRESGSGAGRAADVVGALINADIERGAGSESLRSEQPQSEHWTVREYEWLDGIRNLLHNEATQALESVGKLKSHDDQLDATHSALRLSAAAERLATILRQPLRRAEEIHVRARALRELANRSPDSATASTSLDQARALWESMTEADWPRGKLFAEQALADMEATPDRLRRLLERLARNCEHDVSGGDLEAWAWTLRLFEKRLSGGPAMSDEEFLDGQRLAIARSLRSVTSVPQYKRALAKQIRPQLDACIRRRVEALRDGAPQSLAGKRVRPVDDLIARVEEQSCRELHDLLGHRDLVHDVPLTIAASRAAAERGDGRKDERTLRLSDVLANADRVGSVAVAAEQARLAEEAEWLERPVESLVHDDDICDAVRRFSASQPATVVIRYFMTGSAAGADHPAYMGVVWLHGQTFGPVGIADPADLLQSIRRSEHGVPSGEQATRIWKETLAPLLTELPAGTWDSIIIVPAGDLYELPFVAAAADHEFLARACSGATERRRATEEGPAASPEMTGGLDESLVWATEETRAGRVVPIAAWCAISHCISLTALVRHGRWQNRGLWVDATDDLCVVKRGVEGVFRYSAPESWPTAQRYEPSGSVAASDVLAEVFRREPEYLVLACHGGVVGNDELGVVLDLDGAYMTEFGVATRRWLRRNRLTILAACFSGHGGARGVDVGGLIRAFMAGGCGALLLAPWAVSGGAASAVTAGVLSTVDIERANAAKNDFSRPRRVDEVLRDCIRDRVTERTRPDARIEQCVFKLYL